MSRIYPISKPFITDADRAAVARVLKTDSLSLGPKHREFEKKFARMIGVKYACAVSSGTAGLHLAMIAAGIGPGDEVVTTPFSFIASANCILYVGAKPVFADIDPLSYNIDPKKVEEKITAKTKAILVVHIFGQPTIMEPIVKIAKKHKLKIIEDACESVCAKYKGKQVGTFGESAVFAFYPNKQMTTGEGGMLVTDSRKTYELCCSLRNQGRSGDMRWLDHERLGYNYRMDEMSAALGLAQLAKLGYMIRERAKIAGLYDTHLAGYSDLLDLPRTEKGSTHSWFVYVVRIKDPHTRRDGVMKLLSEQGVSTKPYLPAIHLFRFYRQRFGYKKGDFPISEAVSDSSLALPFYVGLKEKDISHIAGRLIHAIQKSV